MFKNLCIIILCFIIFKLIPGTILTALPEHIIAAICIIGIATFSYYDGKNG